MTIDAPARRANRGGSACAGQRLLTSPILPTLLKLALPNTIAMFGHDAGCRRRDLLYRPLGTEPLPG